MSRRRDRVRRRHPRRPRPRRATPHPLAVRVTTRRQDLLEHLAKLTATSVRTDTRGYQRRACSEHCQERHSHVARQSAYWNVDGARAVIVLYNVTPYLVDQLHAAHAVLREAAPTWPVRPRTELSEQMRRLGWPIPGRKDLP